MEQTPVLGIDFGTSNTAAAWVDGHDRVRVVAVREGVHLLPTVAWYNERGSVLVGAAASQQLQDDPAHTIHGLKRFIGRRWTSPFVHRHKDAVAYRLAEAPDGLVGVELFGQVRPLEDVAVDIFRRIVELASASMRGPVRSCTLTVPAHFGYSQRQVIRRAASRAGLVVRGMVNEPTAAAMYYARKKGEDGRVLIFDLGGGTFDATLLTVMGGVVRVVATGGDAFLGGKDFDQALASNLAERFATDQGVSLEMQRVSLWRLLLAAEQAKVRLSTESSTEVRVPAIGAQGDRFVDLHYNVTRKELERLCAPLVEKCVGICADILRRAELTASEVDEIVFVGGQTRMPQVQKRLGQLFRSHPSKHIHPDLGVAVGAALLTRSDQRLIDVTSAPLGVMIPGIGAKELIPANTTVPSVKRLPLGMRPRPGQPLNLAIYEFPDAYSLEREHLGTVRADAAWLEHNPGALELEAWLGDDLEVTLSLRAGSGERLPLHIDRPSGAHDSTASTQVQHRGTEGGDEALESRASIPEVASTGRPPGFRSVVFTPGADEATPSTSNDSGPLRLPLHIAGDSTGARGAGVAEEGPVAKVGDMVGNYRLLDVIGRGGMGRVYRAEHVLLGRQVALKMLRRRFSDNRQAVARFIAEARAISQIEHDNIVKVTDFIESNEGHVCFVMELLSGHTVAELLRDQGQPPLDNAMRVGAQVCEAVAAVHDAGFIHRDIKPENILLTHHPTRGHVAKLLDFGIAKLVDAGDGEPQTPDLSVGFGTPAYMSPEQLVGGVVDHRADVYGLGMVLYELTTGKRPFDLDESVGNVLLQQLTLPPMPPSQRATTPTGFPAALEQLLLQCLEKDAQRRPRSAREVGARLTAIADQRATLERAMRSLPVGAPDAFDEKTAPLSARELAENQAYDPHDLDLIVTPGQTHAPDPPDAPPDARAPAPQEGGEPTPRGPGRRAAWVASAGIVAAALGIAGTLAWRHYEAHTSPLDAILLVAVAPHRVALPDQVQLSFTSSPPGAEVRLAGKEQRLGTTPFRVSLPPPRTPHDFVFRLAGYREQVARLLPPRADVDVSVHLDALPTPPTPTAPSEAPVVEALEEAP